MIHESFIKEFKAPEFNRTGNNSGQLLFAPAQLNGYRTEELMNSFEPWQNKFKIFSWMQFDKLRKGFTITTLKGHPFLFQPHNTCGWTPGSEFSKSSMMLENPDKVKINEEICYDALFHSCFEPWLTWPRGGNGKVQLNAEAQRMINDVVGLYSQWSTLGLIGQQVMGGYFDLANENTDMVKTVSSSLAGSFMRSSSASEGLFAYFKRAANEDIPWFNMEDLWGGASMFPNAETWNGSFVNMYDKILKDSRTPKSLLKQIKLGGVFSSSNTYSIALVDPLTLLQYVDEYEKIPCIDGKCTNNRLTTEMCVMGGVNTKVYKIDNTYLVPFSIPDLFADYMEGELRFMYIMKAGCVALGGSFEELLGKQPMKNGQAPTLCIERSDKNREYGMISILSHQLIGKLVLNKNLVAGTQIFVRNAK